MSDLTANQVSVLQAIDRAWRTRDEIAIRAGDFHGWTGRLEGLNITLGSFVDRGLVERRKIQGRVHFQLTDKGSVTRRTYHAASSHGGAS